MRDYERVLQELCENSETGIAVRKLLKEKFTMPNIPMYTMGGKVFWQDISEYKGWRIQINAVMKHMRILDPNDLRIAWGTIPGMTKVLEYTLDYINKNKKNNTRPGDSTLAAEKLKQIKELFDLGILDENEYLEKRNKLVKEL